MPWKEEKDPYKVWLSEVILQQTRVEQGWLYYGKFVNKYPTITDLARAKDEDVFKLWEGLGYYTRCRNLLYTARFIDSNYSGKFPSNYAEIAALKGVGPYTAAAIASFCFGLPYAVIDGNVFRILSRVFGIATPVDSAEGKKQFRHLADKVMDRNDPGAFNQAIMDFGATVCKPALPLCIGCDLNNICVAYKTAAVGRLPVREKVIKKRKRWFSYFIFYAKNKVFVRKRISKDIWQNLFEFYLIESESNPDWDEHKVAELLHAQLNIKNVEVLQIIPAKQQQLTHQLIKGYFIAIHLPNIPSALAGESCLWLSEDQVAEVAFPAFINQYLHTKVREIIS